MFELDFFSLVALDFFPSWWNFLVGISSDIFTAGTTSRSSMQMKIYDCFHRNSIEIFHVLLLFFCWFAKRINKKTSDKTMNLRGFFFFLSFINVKKRKDLQQHFILFPVTSFLLSFYSFTFNQISPKKLFSRLLFVPSFAISQPTEYLFKAPFFPNFVPKCDNHNHFVFYLNDWHWCSSEMFNCSWFLAIVVHFPTLIKLYWTKEMKVDLQ